VRLLATTALVAVTIVFLLSMGGGMLFVWWVLVPLHWLAARDRGPTATAGWALLAAASIGEVAWMTAYALAGEGALTVATGAVAFVLTAIGFVAARSRRIAV
jgi:hypothetical protein